MPVVVCGTQNRCNAGPPGGGHHFTTRARHKASPDVTDDSGLQLLITCLTGEKSHLHTAAHRFPSRTRQPVYHLWFDGTSDIFEASKNRMRLLSALCLPLLLCRHLLVAMLMPNHNETHLHTSQFIVHARNKAWAYPCLAVLFQAGEEAKNDIVADPVYCS